ncbi:MAG: M23 family metallopeptidase [Clostridia bacterium]|nr:M23 family metallopeptidase [Clostridia bacterium]
MDKNKDTEKKNKSFYFACVICGIAVIAAGFVVTNSLSVRNNTNYEAALPSPTPKINGKQFVEVKPTPVSTPAPQPVQEVAADPSPNQELASTKLIMPVNGIITVNHSLETMVYSPTFGDWRVHKGIDIDAEPGTEVKAVADGIIEHAYTDEMMGRVIEINHGDFVSVYAGVSTIENVEQGAEIKQGDIISETGNTALNESGQNPHLHFEILYGGNSVDPIEYLKD